MSHYYLSIPALLLASSVAFAQTASSGAVGQSASESGAMAQTGAITFEGSHQRESQRIHTTPHIYAPPSMFGGANNCGQSNTVGMGFTGFGFGGAMASESDACNAREDTAVAAKLGYMDVAQLRFFCFGESANRMAYEAAGYECPSSATTPGINGAPVGPQFLQARMPEQPTFRGRINADGTITPVK